MGAFPDGTSTVPLDYNHPANFLWMAQILGVGIVGGSIYYYWKRRQFKYKNAQLNNALEETRKELQTLSKQLASTMTGMYKMSHDVDPTWFESTESSGKKKNKKKKEQKQ